jgi:hypothetical protein
MSPVQLEEPTMNTSPNRLDNLFNTLLIAATAALVVVAQFDSGDTEVAGAAPQAAPVQVAAAPR